MTTPIQPTPSGSSPGNPSSTGPAHTQADRPQRGGTPASGKHDDAKTTKLPATDTTGEMESSGGGHKSAASSVDSSDRPDLSKGDSPDRRDSSKRDSKSDTDSADRSGTKQQGC